MNYRNILLSFAIFIFMLLFAETYFRLEKKYITYPEQTGAGYISPYRNADRTWYHTIPSYAIFGNLIKEPHTSWVANNEGFRDTFFAIPKSGIRIMMLGDSYTMGVGADNDSSFPKQLSYLLPDTLNSKAQVWNCGVYGSDPLCEFMLFKDKLLRYSPDMAIVVINFSDIQDVTVRGGFERFRPDGTVLYHQGPWFEPLYARSFLVRRVIHDVFHYDRLYLTPSQAETRKLEAYSNLKSAIDSFSDICRDKHIKLLFVFHPTEGDIDRGDTYLVMPLINYCAEKKLPYVDIKQELYRQGIDSSNVHYLFWPEDRHCTNKGYSYFAHSIYKKVIEELQN